MQGLWIGLLWTGPLSRSPDSEVEGPSAWLGPLREGNWRRGWDCPKFSDRVDAFSCRERQRSVGEERFGDIDCQACHQRLRLA